MELAPTWSAETTRSEYDREIAAFVAAIRAGTPPPIPAAHGLTVMRIVDALYRSAETGRQIELADPSGDDEEIAS